MTDLEMLSLRLYRMEVRYRRLQRAVLLGGALLTAGLLMAQAPGTQRQPIFQGLPTLPTVATQAPRSVIEDVIRARQFVLVDTDGNERASLVSDGAGSVFLVMFDKDERPRADMSVTPYGPSINFYDPSGKSRAVIGSTTLVSSHVANESGVVERSPASSIVLFDAIGKLLWRTP
jgi:hypothetical protein